MRAVRAACALALVLALTGEADAQYRVLSVERSGDLARAHVALELAAVEAVVRREATRAAERAAPSIFTSRDLGTHRLERPTLEVQSVRYRRGRHRTEVLVDVSARVTAERSDREVRWEGTFPEVVLVPRGRQPVAEAVLSVAVEVGISPGSIALLVRGRRLQLTDPFDVELDLENRLLHRHDEPVRPVPELGDYRPEAAAIEALDARELRFVVRFRRPTP